MAEFSFDPVSLEGRSLTCVRGGRQVFADLDFKIGRGEAIILRGPNGCGKSSLLRLLAGLLQPADGEIRINDDAVLGDLPFYRSLIHYVGHLPAVKHALTVRENLAFWAGLYDLDADIDGALAHYGLGNLKDLPAKYLSEGQQRRCALARTMVVALPVWLLDEPATGLDDRSVEALGRAMRGHLDGGGILLAAAHGSLPLEGARVLEFGSSGTGAS